MEKQFRKKGIATFEGLNISKGNAVTLKMKFRYDEIITSVELLQGLNTDITVLAKYGDRKPVNLGLFTIGSVNFDKDGNATIPFKSLVQNVNLNDIIEMVDEEYIQLMFRAVLELPDTEVKEKEEEWQD